MHFFYLDEAGDTGIDLTEQPIFVLGGLSVSDEKWKTLEDEYRKKIFGFLGNKVERDFELHTEEMRNRKGIWKEYSFKELNELTLSLIDLIKTNHHKIHFFTIDKRKMIKIPIYKGYSYELNPYFLGYEYIINYVNSYIKSKNLGSTARGIFIIDEKNDNGKSVYYDTIRKITDKCRYEVPINNRLKRIVEFTYPIDSKKNSMIQLSDLIVYCIKKYFEYKYGLISQNQEAYHFYANCFEKIKDLTWRKTFVKCTIGKASDNKLLNEYLKRIGIFK